MASEPVLLQRAYEWIAPYWNAEHLRRTLDWVVFLEPSASLALRLAALTHDMERHFPGPDAPRLANHRDPTDRSYEREHQERSARIVAAWLTEQGADPTLVVAVHRLVAVHEWGGWPEADLLQAADSLSFLEVNVDRFIDFARTGERGLTPAWVAGRFVHMATRIRIPRARALASPLLAIALTKLQQRTGYGPIV